MPRTETPSPNDALAALASTLEEDYRALRERGLDLDLTRGKPCAEQVALCAALDGILHGDYRAGAGADSRNYGLLYGLPEARALWADILGLPAAQILLGDNSSLALFYQAALFCRDFGLPGPEHAWKNHAGTLRFLCPVPGYDRHFRICERLGLEMVCVPMRDDGPDMDFVERAVAEDPGIKGIWCVPRFSNPTGAVYSDQTVARFARLAERAAPDFRIFWDNAYHLHALDDDAPALADLAAACDAAGSADSWLLFSSTSKMTFAGGGICCVAASPANLAAFAEQRAAVTIGGDKVNQLRHVRLLKDRAGAEALMRRHAEILKPKFDLVASKLAKRLAPEPAVDGPYGHWTEPRGGYFVSFDTRPGLATEVVRLTAEAGVKLTPAGATFPHHRDPDDRNIRLSPSYPPLAELDSAMDAFTSCVRLATVRQCLAARR